MFGRAQYWLLGTACGITHHMHWAPDVVGEWWYRHVCCKVGELLDSEDRRIVGGGKPTKLVDS